MTRKRATLLLLIAGLAGSPAPGAAWELATHCDPPPAGVGLVSFA
jgi:hypothetical protein